MKKRSYKVSCYGIDATVTYFEEEWGGGRREPLGEIFDKVSDIHQHTEQEVFFVLGGEMELMLENGKLCFSNCAVVVPAGMGHYTAINAERVFVLYFSTGNAFFSELFREVSSFAIGNDARMYVEKLAEGARGDDGFHLVSLLFSAFVRQIAPEVCRETETVGAVGKYAFEIDEYIEAHYTEGIRLFELAEHLHLCEKQVSRVIKREYGYSFSSLVNQKRLSVAAMMLRHTDMTVADIARRVGYDSDNYFYRVFKRKYGLTPVEYRNQKNGS